VRITATVVVVFAMVLVAAAGGKPPPRPVEAAVVPTGPAPCGIAARAGSLWVGVYEAGALLRLDERGRREARVRVGAWPCRVAVGRAALWVTRDRAGEVVRIALGSGTRKQVRVGPGAFDVLLAVGSAWATSFDAGTVSRIDPATTRSTRVYEVGPNPAGLAPCGGLIWVGHGRDATSLSSIDPDTHLIRRVPVRAEGPGWPRCVRGTLWVTTADSVLRLDPRTGRVLSKLRIGGTPADAALGPDDLVWVTDKQRSLVHRVTLDGRSVVDSFPAGAGAFALVRVKGSMWITSFAGSDVRRYTP
jgi:streptogramin lyase